jgi:hypothetical protein
MATSGFFLGGVSQGVDAALEQARKDALLELQNKQFGLQQQVAGQNYDIANQRVGIDQQSLDLRQRDQQFQQQQTIYNSAQANVADLTKSISDTISLAKAAGKSPDEISNAVSPLLSLATTTIEKMNKAFPGIPARDPRLLFNQTMAVIHGPSQRDLATASGEAQRAKDEASGAGWKYQQIGEDGYGNKKFGFVNGATQQVMEPKIPAATPTPPNGAVPVNTDPATGLPAEARVDTMHGDEYLRTLEPKQANTVKAIVEGRMAPPSSFAASKPYWQKVLADVAQYEPNFDMTAWTTRNQARKEFNAGGPNSPAGQITAGNTAIQHLKQLSDAADALENGGWTGINWIRNEFRTKTGSPLVTNYNNILSKYVEEATKFYRGAGGTESDIQRDIGNLTPNGSPAQLHQGIATAAHLMASKIDALQARYKNALGPGSKDFPILTDSSASALEAINRRSDKTKGIDAGSGLPNPPPGFSVLR